MSSKIQNSLLCPVDRRSESMPAASAEQEVFSFCPHHPPIRVPNSLVHGISATQQALYL